GASPPVAPASPVGPTGGGAGFVPEPAAGASRPVAPVSPGAPAGRGARSVLVSAGAVGTGGSAVPRVGTTWYASPGVPSIRTYFGVRGGWRGRWRGARAGRASSPS